MFVRSFLAAVVSCVVVMASAPSHSQFSDLTGTTKPEEIKLTEALVNGFIAAQPEMIPLMQKNVADLMNRAEGITDPAQYPKPDPAIIAEMETVIKKHGFASQKDYTDTAATIMSAAMSSLFKGTENFERPVDDSAKVRAEFLAEIESVNAEQQLTAVQKTYIVAKLNKAMARVKPPKYPENYELLGAMSGKLKAMMDQMRAASTPPQ
jgi:hypothetical protein